MYIILKNYFNYIAFSLVRKLLYFCLAVFPLLMFYFGLTRFFQIEHEERKKDLQHFTEQTMQKLREYSDDSRYFHLLLQNAFSCSEMKESTWQSQLENTVKSLKDAFPGGFSFIFWDAQGELIADLSDENRFSYLSKRLQKLLSGIRSDTMAGRHFGEDFSSRYNRELRMLRQFLGPFITPETLVKPFLDESSATCFQMHARGERFLGWYGESKKFSVLVFVSDKICRKLLGARRFIEDKSDKQAEVSYFLFNHSEQKIFPEEGSSLLRETAINLEKFKKMSPDDQLVSSRHFFSFLPLKDNWWIVAAGKRQLLTDGPAKARQLFARSIAAIFIAVFVLNCYLLVHESIFHSVKIKLVMIFGYSVFIPALLFALISFDYLKEKEKQLITEATTESFQLLTSIDSQFSGFLHELSEKLNASIDQAFAKTADEEFNDRAKSAGSELFNRFQPYSFIISDDSGKDILASAFSSNLKDDVLRRTATKELIKYLNIDEENVYRPVQGIAEAFLINYPVNHRRLLALTVTNWTFMSYIYTRNSSNKNKASHIIQFFWLEKDLQLNFFKQMVYLNKNYHNRQIIISFPESGQSWPPRHKINGLSALRRRAKLHGSSHGKLFDRNGNPWLAVCQKGNILKSVILTSLIDHRLVAAKIESVRNRVISLAGWSILVCLSLFYLLARFLIQPIKAMSIGIEMVKMRNYSHRIAMPIANEFGKLSKSIDGALENLQELEIARVVQESLLPQDSLDLDNYIVVAESKSMKSIGGDYYDFFVDDHKNAAVLMADVSGHGVQAALLMAMAKSTLLLNETSCIRPAEIMKSLNRIFFSLREANIRTMMTGQLVCLGNSEEPYLINSGHCSPLIVSRDGKQAVPVYLPSLPFGFSPNRCYEPFPLDLKPGETLILFSDGILECSNKNRQVMQEEGCIEMVKACFDPDCKRYLQNIFSAYNDFSASQQDDITFVLIKRKELTIA